jgi:hypothetical protein
MQKLTNPSATTRPIIKFLHFFTLNYFENDFLVMISTELKNAKYASLEAESKCLLGLVSHGLWAQPR